MWEIRTLVFVTAAGGLLAGCASGSSGHVVVGGASASDTAISHAQPSSSNSTTPGLLYPTFGPSGTLGTSNDPRFVRTLHTVQAELLIVPLPPGATRVNDVPVPVLSQPSSWSQCSGLVDRAGYWTLAANLGTTIAYARSHPPDHLRVVGGSTGTARGVYDESVTFGNISHAGDLEIQVAATALGNGTAVRVDVQSVWNYPDGCEFGGTG